jgi:hypothetical protein
VSASETPPHRCSTHSARNVAWAWWDWEGLGNLARLFDFICFVVIWMIGHQYLSSAMVWVAACAVNPTLPRLSLNTVLLCEGLQLKIHNTDTSMAIPIALLDRATPFHWFHICWPGTTYSNVSYRVRWIEPFKWVWRPNVLLSAPHHSFTLHMMNYGDGLR